VPATTIRIIVPAESGPRTGGVLGIHDLVDTTCAERSVPEVMVVARRWDMLEFGNK